MILGQSIIVSLIDHRESNTLILINMRNFMNLSRKLRQFIGLESKKTAGMKAYSFTLQKIKLISDNESQSQHYGS